MALPPDALNWIEQQLGARIVEVEQQGRWRPHHFITVAQPDGTTTQVLARSPRDPELIDDSRFLSHFSLEREARVLEALQGVGVKIPEFLGFSDQHQLILMSKVDGTNDLSLASDDAARRRIMNEYVEELAQLHDLDVSTMRLTGLDVPHTPSDIALAGKFSFMEADFATARPTLRPEPLLELGIWWLHANIPQGARRVSFVQGDTGPGQLMFADDRLTALIDWELAHVGDPMLDLGVARMRNMLYPVGSLHETFAHYERVTGRPLDRPALRYYTVLATLLSPLGMAATLQRPSAKVGSMLVRYGWDVTLRRGMTDALAEELGLEITPPDLPPRPSDDDPTLFDYLAEHLELLCVPLAHDAAERFQLDSALAISRTLQLDSKIGDRLLRDDLDDMAEVLGHRPTDREAGMAALAELVAAKPDTHLESLVMLFGRVERRREFLLAPMMIAQSTNPLEPLPPLA
jgi:aminoglycoside phosphotransferase (APT) family kinase protein